MTFTVSCKSPKSGCKLICGLSDILFSLAKLKYFVVDNLLGGEILVQLRDSSFVVVIIPCL